MHTTVVWASYLNQISLWLKNQDYIPLHTKIELRMHCYSFFAPNAVKPKINKNRSFIKNMYQIKFKIVGNSSFCAKCCIYEKCFGYFCRHFCTQPRIF